METTNANDRPLREPIRWVAAPPESKLEFSLRHLVLTQIKGRVAQWQATVATDLVDPTRSTVEVSIDATSLATGDLERDAHVRSAEFLNAAEYPQISFVSREIRGDQAQGRFTVRGDLTIRAVSREIIVEVQRLGEAAVDAPSQPLQFTGRTTINRQAFGLRWNQDLDTGGVVVGDAIEILFRIEARPRARTAEKR